MGKTILTPKQFEFLELVKVESQVTRAFYLTGGTALSEFYLKHRLSEDLDFFTEEKEVDQGLKEIDILETPRLLVPFDKRQMDNFFVNEAKKLREGIFEA